MVYDCFMFFNELELLEIRLHELASVVDRFVLCEGDRTFSGKPKPLWFADNRHLFRDFDDKIVHLMIRGKEWPDGHDSWTREWHQRNHLATALQRCADEDLILISDADEIPCATAMAAIEPLMGYRKFEQIHHYYYLNTQCGIWAGSVAISYSELKRVGSTTGARYLPTNDRVLLRPGGWHFSYLGGVERIRNKIESFAHTELDRAEIKDLGILERRIARNEDIFGRPGHRYCDVELDQRYPRYLLENRSKFQHLIRRYVREE